MSRQPPTLPLPTPPPGHRRARLGAAALRLVVCLAAGMMLLFYSERVFWSRMAVSDTPSDLLLLWIAYSMLAFTLLAALDWSRARDWQTVFLCGALYGWLGEGAVAQTMFAAFPLQVSWTGLAWHALITVLFGWYYLRRAYLQGRWRQAVALASGLGVFWGLWALWWQEDLGAPIAPLSFAANAALFGGLLVLASAVYERLQPSEFRPSRLEWLIVGGFFLFWAVNAMLSVPYAILILPAALGLTLFALRRSRQRAVGPGLLATLHGPFTWRAAGVLLLMPLVGTAVYSLAWSLGAFGPTNLVTLWITLPVGFLLYGLALAHVLRLPPPAAALDQP